MWTDKIKTQHFCCKFSITYKDHSVHLSAHARSHPYETIQGCTQRTVLLRRKSLLSYKREKYLLCSESYSASSSDGNVNEHKNLMLMSIYDIGMILSYFNVLRFECQGYLLGGGGGGGRQPVHRADNIATLMCRLCRNTGSPYLVEPSGPIQSCFTGVALRC